MYSVNAKATAKGKGPRLARRARGTVTESITLFRRAACKVSSMINGPDLAGAILLTVL